MSNNDTNINEQKEQCSPNWVAGIGIGGHIYTFASEPVHSSWFRSVNNLLKSGLEQAFGLCG